MANKVVDTVYTDNHKYGIEKADPSPLGVLLGDHKFVARDEDGNCVDASDSLSRLVERVKEKG
ncbi:MAG: hypothetical protein PHS95_00505 [Candidatus Pacebacteria bacterium]|nr:hypothetical protein [Candidatus Paceibacterota bacterium]